jgi:hypothetical protein
MVHLCAQYSLPLSWATSWNCISYKFYYSPPTDAKWAGLRSRYSDCLRARRYGDRIPVWARFSAPVQTGPGAHPASCTMGTGSFPGVKNRRGVTLTPNPILLPWSRKGRVIPLLPLWAVRPVQSLSACTRVHFTYFLLTLRSLPLRFCGSQLSHSY